MRIGAVRSLRLVGVFLTAAALLLVPSTALAKKHKKKPPKKVNVNMMYTMTNDPTGNKVVVFKRHANGTITQGKSYKTGGKGLAGTPPFDFPIADGSGSVNLTPDGKLLFVINAGDNSVSSFKITGHGPKLVSHVSSGGSLPISVTSNGDLLYVVNEGTSTTGGNIYGYRFSQSGHLSRIPHSSQRLATMGPVGTAADPAEIDFSPNGRTLVVTLRETDQPDGMPNDGVIDTFKVDHNGKAGPATATRANAQNPFGFSFAGSHLEVSNAGVVDAIPPTNDLPDPTKFAGSASTYNLSGSGVTAVGSPVLSGGRAACWLVVTKNNKFAFVSNTLSDTPPDAGHGTNAVSEYKVAGNGALTLQGQVSTGAPTGGPTFPSDMALSSDSKFLYLINPVVMPPPGATGNTGHVDVYRVGSNGTLTLIQSTTPDLALGMSGAAAH